MSLLEQLDAHAQRITAANRRVREVHLEVAAAAAKVDEINNEIIEAHAAEDSALVGKLEKTLTAAELTAKRLREQKFVGAQRAAQRAEADRLTFVGQNYAALIDEQRPKAEEVAEGVEKAVAALAQAHAAWQGVEAQVMELMRLAGKGHERTPPFPQQLERVVRDVERLGAADVPAPIPVAAKAEPDPEREAYMQAQQAQQVGAWIGDDREAA